MCGGCYSKFQKENASRSTEQCGLQRHAPRGPQPPTPSTTTPSSAAGALPFFTKREKLIGIRDSNGSHALEVEGCGPIDDNHRTQSTRPAIHLAAPRHAFVVSFLCPSHRGATNTVLLEEAGACPGHNAITYHSNSLEDISITCTDTTGDLTETVIVL